MSMVFLLGALSLLLLQAETRQASGVKVGEVTDRSAIVWMRHTAKSAREADGACPGAPGKVRVRYWSREDRNDLRSTEWADVTAAADFAHQFTLSGLEPGTVYRYVAETDLPAGLEGRFATAPSPDRAADVSFVVITGQAYKDLDHADGFHIYEAMAKLNPHFIVPTGDTVYYDNDPPLAATKELARLHWERMYSLPRHVAFHLQVPGYWEKDDHDTIWNDSWPTMKVDPRVKFTFEDGKKIFLEQVPMGERTYRTARWGKRLQVWMVEGRDFRSANTMKDGPAKTIWGAEQKAWFKKTVLESDAEWKVLVSPTPMVGPDRGNKGDNHANPAFAHEQQELLSWIRDHAPANFFIACGDRHWQYHSVHPGSGVHEYSCGPASDQHAGGSPGENQEYHRFHRVKGGFLSVNVTAAGIAFRFHDVLGRVVYEHAVKR